MPFVEANPLLNEFRLKNQWVRKWTTQMCQSAMS